MTSLFTYYVIIASVLHVVTSFPVDRSTRDVSDPEVQGTLTAGINESQTGYVADALSSVRPDATTIPEVDNKPKTNIISDNDLHKDDTIPVLGPGDPVLGPGGHSFVSSSAAPSGSAYDVTTPTDSGISAGSDSSNVNMEGHATGSGLPNITHMNNAPTTQNPSSNTIPSGNADGVHSIDTIESTSIISPGDGLSSTSVVPVPSDAITSVVPLVTTTSIEINNAVTSENRTPASTSSTPIPSPPSKASVPVDVTTSRSVVGELGIDVLISEVAHHSIVSESVTVTSPIAHQTHEATTSPAAVRTSPATSAGSASTVMDTTLGISTTESPTTTSEPPAQTSTRDSSTRTSARDTSMPVQYSTMLDLMMWDDEDTGDVDHASIPDVTTSVKPVISSSLGLTTDLPSSIDPETVMTFKSSIASEEYSSASERPSSVVALHTTSPVTLVDVSNRDVPPAPLVTQSPTDGDTSTVIATSILAQGDNIPTTNTYHLPDITVQTASAAPANDSILLLLLLDVTTAPSNITNTTDSSSDVSGLSASAKAGIIAGIVILFWLVLGPVVCIVWHARDTVKQRSRGYFQNGTWFPRGGSGSTLGSFGKGTSRSGTSGSSPNERVLVQEMISVEPGVGGHHQVDLYDREEIYKLNTDEHRYSHIFNDPKNDTKL